MIRLVLYLAMLAGMAYGGWWVWNNCPEVRRLVEQNLPKQGMLTLEIRHTPEEIMNLHRTDLLKNSRYSFLDPATLFYPYLLMDVKYTVGNATKEGVVLWGLDDGEMVLDAQNWSKTHGFEDCIIAGATETDFRVLNALAKRSGYLDRDALLRTLRADPEVADPWIASCKEKKLIVVSGNGYRLHFASPVFETRPETLLTENLVTTPHSAAMRVAKQYTASEVEKTARAAFGQDFTIRSVKEVYLPVYSLVIQNPDGTLLTTYWNALTGKQLKSRQRA